MNKPANRPAEILLVEDNDTDVQLTLESFRRSKLNVHVTRAEHGQECLDILRKLGPHANAPTPDLILLDLNMPVMDGREVLAEMVKDEALRHLPVVVLSTSNREEDIVAMYKLRCNAYVRKPVGFARFQEILEALAKHWFTVVVLPPVQDKKTDV